jgi:hypothetical protein
MNKVLNRPMFRREALRKGVLKPIKARVGQYIAQGPMMQQGPMPAQGPYSMIPTEYQGPKGKSFFYDPRAGSYLTDYGKAKIGRGLKGFGSGLLGITALYEGARAGGVPDPLVNAAYYSELAGLPLSLAKNKTAKTVGRMLSTGSRLAATNPISAIGIGGALTLGGGTKSYFDERKMVEDYAKANNIPVKKAMDIFNRDLVGRGGRPITDFRKSDIGKAILSVSSARNVAAGGLDKKPEGPPGSQSYEQRVAGEMRNYFDASKTYGRYYQDVDQLVNNVREQEKRFNMNYDVASMSPDDMMQIDQQAAYDKQQLDLAQIELRNALAVQKDIDPFRASNIAVAVTEGKLKPEEIDAASTNDDVYSKVENKMGDPNHPESIKIAKTEEEIKKKTTNENTSEQGKKTGATGTGGNSEGQKTGDPEIDTAKAYGDLGFNVNLKDLDPRSTAIDPKQVFLLKLAEGLLSGKTRQGGLAGAAEVFGTALGPAVDASILVKMKNDEAYRSFAATVLDYNTELLKARNDLLKGTKRKRGSISMGGKFYEAFTETDTGEIFVVDPKTGEYRNVSTVDATFFPEQDSSAYVDNIRLVADGALSSQIIRDQLALMNTEAGKRAIGASGLILSFAETIGNLPSEIMDGIVGSVSSTFDQTVPEDATYTNAKGKNKGNFEENTNRILNDFTKGIDSYLKNNASASETLGKLKVNSRMLTYTLANALKDKDRLTNRDLQLIEELTGTLSTEPDAKIIQKYEELLRRVEQKNNLRLTKFYTMGYTPEDVRRILEPIQGQMIDQFAPEMLTMDDAFAAFGVQ